jgi:hypothetical protein
MSDHGSSAFIGGAPDVRWDDNDLACIKKFHASDLEVVDNSALEVSSISGQTKPYVVPSILPGATVGTSYSASIAAVGGNPATLRWAVSSGALPPGLQLNASTGTISGSPTSSSGSPYSFSITVTDTASLLASQPQAFSIAATGGSTTVAVTVSSSPVGRSVTVDGTIYTTPASFNWVAGSNHTLTAPSPQGTGTRYVFSTWSDSGTQTHTVAPTANTTFTAGFTTQYLLTTSVSPAGSGTIAANPASPDGYYNTLAIVQLTASPAAGFAFAGFSGGLTGSTNPQNLTISAPVTVTANFGAAPAPPPVPVLNSPLNATTGISRTPSLRWTAASGATSYDVYLGTSPSPTLVKNTTATNYSPAELAGSTIYYWRVVAKNSVGSASSVVWSFTTTKRK